MIRRFAASLFVAALLHAAPGRAQTAYTGNCAPHGAAEIRCAVSLPSADGPLVTEIRSSGTSGPLGYADRWVSRCGLTGRLDASRQPVQAGTTTRLPPASVAGIGGTVCVEVFLVTCTGGVSNVPVPCRTVFPPATLSIRAAYH